MIFVESFITSFYPFLFLLHILAMTAITTDCDAATTSSGVISLQGAFVLIPSQVPSVRHPTPEQKNRKKNHAQTVLHAQDVNSNQYDILMNDDDASGGDVVVYNQSSAAAAPVPAASGDSSVPSRTSSVARNNGPVNNTRRGKVVLSRTGNLPDVNW